MKKAYFLLLVALGSFLPQGISAKVTCFLRWNRQFDVDCLGPGPGHCEVTCKKKDGCVKNFSEPVQMKADFNDTFYDTVSPNYPTCGDVQNYWKD